MQDYDLPSPDIGSKGLELRRIAAKNISSLEIIALGYPGGKHPGAAKLRQFFLSCAAALGEVIVDPDPEPNPGTLEPNPVPTPTTIAGPVNSLAFTDTGNRRHRLAATINGSPGGYLDFFYAGTTDGASALGWRLFDGSRFSSIRRLANGGTEEGFPAYQPFPAELPTYTNFPTDVKMELGADGFHRLFVDEFLLYQLDVNQYLSDPSFGTFVGISGAADATYTNITYGVVGAGEPIRVSDQTLVGTYQPQAVVTYTGDPGGIQMRFRTSGGATLIDWHDGLLVDPTKGRVTVESPNSIPTSEFGQSVIIEYRFKNAVGTITSAAVKMPAGRPRLGMNLTAPGFLATQQIMKNLLYANDGWRSGSSYITPASHPSLFNANGDLIASGGFNPIQAFGRCSVPGDLVEVTWEGGDNPLTDVDLAGGPGTSYSNIVKTARRIVFNYNFSWEGLDGRWGNVEQKGFYSSNPVTNIRVKRVSQSWDGGAFADDYIERTAKNDYVRLMDMGGSNAANYIPETQPFGVEWSDRSDINKYGYLGLAPELIIELAWRANVDIVVMSPAGSSPDYNQRFVKGLFNGEGMRAYSNIAAGRGLPVTCTVYYELGNEWFNSGFGLYGSAWRAARANGRSTGKGENEDRIAEWAYRLKMMWAAIDGLYPAGRLKKFVMGNPGDTYDAFNLNAAGAGGFDVYGCAYYTHNIKFEDETEKWPGPDIDAMFAFAEATINPQISILRLQKQWADDHNKAFWIYEGNPSHWLELRNTMPYADPTFYVAFQQHPKMEGMTTKWLNGWISNFDGGLTGFNDFGQPSAQYGPWGFTSGMADLPDLVKSPKQRAWNTGMAFLNS